MADKTNERVISDFTSFSEQELVAFAEKEGVCLTKGELLYLKEACSESKHALTVDELKLFGMLQRAKRATPCAEFARVDFDTPNPHIAESYATYLRVVEQIKEKTGAYPSFSDLANASWDKARARRENKPFGSAQVKVAYGDNKSEDGKFAYTLCMNDESVEQMIFDGVITLIESRYMPFSARIIGEYKEPDRERSVLASDIMRKIGIGTVRRDIYDLKADDNGRESLVLCGYAQANAVAKHYAKEEDRIFFLERSDSITFLRKLISLVSDRRAVKLIVDSRFAKKGEFLPKLISLTQSFNAENQSNDGLIVICRPRDEEELKSALAEKNIVYSVVGSVTPDGKIASDCIDIPYEILSGNETKDELDISLTDKKSRKAHSVSGLAGVYLEKGDVGAACNATLADYGVCSQKGLTEQYDFGTIARLAPLGGKYGLTPSDASLSAFPLMGSKDGLIMGEGAFPSLFAESPFICAVNSIASAVAKVVLCGARRSFVSVCTNAVYKKGDEGKALSALLGGFVARRGLGVDTGSNGISEGDSEGFMASAFASLRTESAISNVFDRVSRVYRLSMKRDEHGMIDLDYLARVLDTVYENIESGNITSATVVGEGGAQASIIRSCIGNGLGFDFDKNATRLFESAYGDIIVACNETAGLIEISPEYMGSTDTDGRFDFSKDRSLNNFGVTQSFTASLEGVYRSIAPSRGMITNVRYKTDKSDASEEKFNRPQVLIPVFSGTIESIELSAKFKSAGGDVCMLDLQGEEQEKAFVDKLNESVILVLCDGVGVADEICTFIRKVAVFEAVESFVKDKKGLIYGEGEGAEALVRLGLISGKLRKRDDESITLVAGNLARPVYTTSEIRVASVLSPWLYGAELGERYVSRTATSRGAFRFAEGVLDSLIEKGQIATQYVDYKGFATMESPCNPTGSCFAVDTLTSPCGRIIARIGKECSVINKAGNSDIKIIESGVKYFK